MKRYSLLVAILLCSQWCLGQENVDAEDEILPSELTYGFSITPKVAVFMPNYYEKRAPLPTFGLDVSGDLYYGSPSSFLSLRTGLGFVYYSMYGARDYSWSMVCNVGGDREPSYPYLAPKVNALYLGIPLEAMFKMVGKENFLYSSLGMKSWLRLFSQTKTKSHECGAFNPTTASISSAPSNQRKGLLLLTYGLGYELKLAGQRRLMIEPRLEYQLVNVLKKSVSSRSFANPFNPHDFLNIGLRVGLKI